jgi:hypothetical protein
MRRSGVVLLLLRPPHSEVITRLCLAKRIWRRKKRRKLGGVLKVWRRKLPALVSFFFFLIMDVDPSSIVH